MKLAAIDIGSNAARLLISEVTKQPKQDPVFNKKNLVRVPLRLGFDVFETGEISKAKVKMLMQTLKAYQHLLEAYEIKHVYACATSAMRDARNSKDIIRKVKLETGIEIKVLPRAPEGSADVSAESGGFSPGRIQRICWRKSPFIAFRSSPE